MVFNSDKFECISFRPKGQQGDLTYSSPSGTDIEVKTHLRDLGVEISNDLSFSLQIANVVTSANRIVGWALRTFRRRSRFVMLTI